MNQVQTPEKDLLDNEDFSKNLSRSTLMPWWFHVWQVVLLMIINFFIGFSWFYIDLGSMEIPRFISLILNLMIILSIGIVTGCILIWCRWKYAIDVMLAPSVMMSLYTMGLFTVLVMEGVMEMIISLVCFAAFLGYTIRIFRMRKVWKEASR